MSNKDFGPNDFYYQIGSEKTVDKLKAIILSEQQNNTMIRYHIPEYFNHFPFHIEPEESMKQLCIQRAKEIREKYDYIRIWFSGGCDSMYLLKIFVENEIFIDEIMSMKCGFVESDWEIENVAIPFLRSIKDKIPGTKITIKAPSINDYKEWYKTEYWFENYRQFGRASKSHFAGLRLNEMLESINYWDVKTLTANVWGQDKPFIHFIQGNWYTRFLDIDNQIQEQTHLNRYVNFYNDDARIFTKQCHLLKKSLIKNLPKSEWNKVCMWDKKYQALWNYSCERIESTELFIVKSLTDSLGENIDALNQKEASAQKIVQKEFPEIYKNYEAGIKNLNQIHQGKWFNNKNAKRGTVGIFSNFFCLDKNLTKTVDELFPNGFKL